MAFGIANLGTSFTGGYPVTGGVSRSVVNYSAGANTGLASIISGCLLAITVLFLTSLFYFLPQACLAAIIITAVYQLIDLSTFKRMWSYDRADGIAWLATFLIVLSLGVSKGIIFWRVDCPGAAPVAHQPSPHCGGGSPGRLGAFSQCVAVPGQNLAPGFSGANG